MGSESEREPDGLPDGLPDGDALRGDALAHGVYDYGGGVYDISPIQSGNSALLDGSLAGSTPQAADSKWRSRAIRVEMALQEFEQMVRP